MGFAKAFLFSLIAFIGFNFIFTIIYYAFGPGFNLLFETIGFAPLMILFYLFGSIVSTPYVLMNWTFVFPVFVGEMTYMILGIGYLVALIIAAILAGRFGESKIQSFGGWVLTAVISTISLLIGALSNETFQITLLNTYGWSSNDVILLYSTISCIINIVFYGFFALLLSKIEYY
jgi:hypothetical protein